MALRCWHTACVGSAVLTNPSDYPLCVLVSWIKTWLNRQLETKAGQASQCFWIWQDCRPNQYVETPHPGSFKSLMCTFRYVISLQDSPAASINTCHNDSCHVYHNLRSYLQSSFHWLLWIGFHTSTTISMFDQFENGNEQWVLSRWSFPVTVCLTCCKFKLNKQLFVEHSVVKYFLYIYIYTRVF